MFHETHVSNIEIAHRALPQRTPTQHYFRPVSPPIGRSRGVAVAARLLLACAAFIAVQGCIRHDQLPQRETGPADGSGVERRDGAREVSPLTESPFHLLEAGETDQWIRTWTLQLTRRDELKLPIPKAGYYADVQEARLRQALPVNTAALVRDGESITLRISGSFAFRARDNRLTPSMESMLHTLSDVLLEFEKTIVVVYSRPARDAADHGRELRMSEQRTLVVARYLVEHGIRTERIAVVRRGSSGRPDGASSSRGDESDRPLAIQLLVVVDDAKTRRESMDGTDGEADLDTNSRPATDPRAPGAE